MQAPTYICYFGFSLYVDVAILDSHKTVTEGGCFLGLFSTPVMLWCGVFFHTLFMVPCWGCVACGCGVMYGLLFFYTRAKQFILEEVQH
jgi:hypothetical protein